MSCSRGRRGGGKERKTIELGGGGCTGTHARHWDLGRQHGTAAKPGCVVKSAAERAVWPDSPLPPPLPGSTQAGASHPPRPPPPQPSPPSSPRRGRRRPQRRRRHQRQPRRRQRAQRPAWRYPRQSPAATEGAGEPGLAVRRGAQCSGRSGAAVWRASGGGGQLSTPGRLPDMRAVRPHELQAPRLLPKGPARRCLPTQCVPLLPPRLLPRCHLPSSRPAARTSAGGGMAAAWRGASQQAAAHACLVHVLALQLGQQLLHALGISLHADCGRGRDSVGGRRRHVCSPARRRQRQQAVAWHAGSARASRLH